MRQRKGRPDIPLSSQKSDVARRRHPDSLDPPRANYWMHVSEAFVEWTLGLLTGKTSILSIRQVLPRKTEPHFCQLRRTCERSANILAYSLPARQAHLMLSSAKARSTSSISSPAFGVFELLDFLLAASGAGASSSSSTSPGVTAAEAFFFFLFFFFLL